MKTRLQVQVQRRKQLGTEDAEVSVSPASDTFENAADAIFQILRDEGISGLYSGLSSSILGTASMNFTYFYWSEAARRFHGSALQFFRLPDTNGIIKELGLGAVGGAMAQLCTNPIAVIITRQQTSKCAYQKSSMWETMREIVQSEDGWTGLWRGLKVNLILVVNPMITYGVYQWLRERLLTLKREIGVFDTFCMFHLAICADHLLLLTDNTFSSIVLGALSKVLATITTHPLIVAKTMLQSKPPEGRQGKPFRSFTEVLLYILQHEGIFRLFKGLAPQITKGFLVQGLVMLLKERYVELLEFFGCRNV